MGLQLPASRSPDRDSARTVLTREDIVKRLDNGGRVLLASALTGKGYSAKIALTDAQLARLRERYGSLEPWWRDTFGYGFDGLTESEARFLLTLKDRPGPDALRARVDAARVRAGSGLDAGNDPDGGDRPPLARLSPDEGPARAAVDVDRAVRDITSAWTNAPRVRVVQAASDLPARVVREFNRYGSDGSDVRGVYLPDSGDIYLVRQNLHSRREVEVVLFHEVIGHHGLRLIFGADTDRQVQRLLNAVGGMPGLRRLADRWDIDLSAYSAVLDRNDLTRDQQAAILFDELFAHLAERIDILPTGLMQKVREFIGAIRAWLRQHGFTALAGELTDAEVAHLLRRARRAVQGDAGTSVAREGVPALFRRAEAITSEAFRRWFGASRVVNPDGTPKVVYHGTADEFWAFDKGRLASSTGHMSAPLGFFFAESRASAERYARNAADGVPADERVIDAYLAIQNPKRMTVDELMEIDSREDARALRERLQREGYDGIHIADANQWVAFEPTQVKSASENRGTFDPGNPDMRFSLQGGAADPFAPAPGEADAYREALAKLMADRRTTPPPIKVGATPAVLRILGVPNLPITISQDVVRKATNGVRHDVPLDVIQRLPELLADPVAVFKARQIETGFNLVLQADDASSRRVMVALHTRVRENRLEVNRIASAYGRPDHQYRGWVRDGLLLYVADARNPDSVRLVGLQLPVSGSPNRGSANPGEATLMGLQLPASRSPDRDSARTVLTREDIVKRLESERAAGAPPSGARFSFRAPARPTPADLKIPGEVQLSRSAYASVREWLSALGKGKLTDLRPAVLASVPLNHLRDWAGPRLSAVDAYIDQQYQMQAFRMALYREYDAIAQRWLKFATVGAGPLGLLGRRQNAAGRALADLMHDSTVAGVDPTLDASEYAKDPFLKGGRPRWSRPRA